MSAPSRIHLEWTGEELRFRGGRPAGPHVTLDSGGEEGPSPTDALLLSLAGCMGVDIVHILKKARVPVEGLSVDVEGERAEDPPRRFERIRLVYTVSGPEEDHRDRLERAVELSRDKYCSVLHTLKEDIDFQMEIRRG